MPTKLNVQRWGRLKAGLTRVINRSRRFVDEEMASDTIIEAKDLLAQLKSKYNGLVNALDEDIEEEVDAPDYDEEMDNELQRYSDARAAVVGKLKEAEDRQVGASDGTRRC